jgi:23S rRNA pseudouridine2605 synthase
LAIPETGRLCYDAPMKPKKPTTNRTPRKRRDAAPTGGDRKRFGKDPKGKPAKRGKPAEASGTARIESADPSERGERIAKVMARAGLCSRRTAESWIMDGRVQLNGRVLETPAVTVSGDDKVLVDGNPLPTRERTRLWLYHKPRGLVTTNRDPEGRSTVFEKLPAELPRVLAVGRLDINTEGLLLLTNDGGLARVLELPATGWLRRYRVRAFGKVTQADLDGLSDGIAIEGVLYGAIEATLDKEQGDNVWLTVGLREGKNREVKRVLEHLGLSVNRLIRLSFGPFQLQDLSEGDVREIRGRVLRDQLGEKLIEEAGADFDAPIFHAAKPDQEKKQSARAGQRDKAAGSGSQGRWLTTRDGEAAARSRSARKSGAGGASHRPKTGDGRPKRDFSRSPRDNDRDSAGPTAPKRRIWGEEGLLEDKQQERRTDPGKGQRSNDSDRPSKGGSGGRGGPRRRDRH